jgi:hypothetical protein
MPKPMCRIRKRWQVRPSLEADLDRTATRRVFRGIIHQDRQDGSECFPIGVDSDAVRRQFEREPYSSGAREPLALFGRILNNSRRVNSDAFEDFLR